MRGKSHHCLGKYLSDRFFYQVPKSYQLAFLWGCVEPDRNPLTYLKGSLEHAWLRGHNYHNARRFLHRLSLRLECKETWNLWDYYSLGKLIHYTADAFTQAHNENFPKDLDAHRIYETHLQRHFLQYLATDPDVEIRLSGSIMQIIMRHHAEYLSETVGLHKDIHYILSACCCIFALLFTCRIV